MSEWRNIKDDLPGMGEVVLVWGCDELPITAYRANAIPHPKWFDYQEDLTISGVTHWMALPQPPGG